jgi:regulator of sigma E protease
MGATGGNYVEFLGLLDGMLVDAASFDIFALIAPLFAISLAGVLTTIKNIALVAIGLSFVIFVHEMGHFLVAKAFGVKCEKFYVGFDVPITLGPIRIPGKLFHFHWGETEYGLGAIPLGGYVKMLGQDDNPNNAETEGERTRIEDEQGNVRLDPRSYPAKPVWQRMAIISAGVIMNLIFGFFFAAIAYRVGVMIQPAQVGSTAAGDPAWQVGLLPGDRIVQIGKNGTHNEHMRFRQDMMMNFVLYTNYDKQTGYEPIDLKIRRRDGRQEWFTLKPSDRLKGEKDARPTIGILNSKTPVLAEISEEQLPFVPSSHAEFVSGDRVIAINGEGVSDDADLERLLAQSPQEPIEVRIERQSDESASPQQHTVTIQPLPARDYGVVMEMSPITAIQQGSPAEAAGFQVGDRLLNFDGEPIGDPLSLPQRTLRHVGETVDVEVERSTGASSQVATLTVTLREPQQTSTMSRGSQLTPSVSVETLGISYDVTNRVAQVRSGGPADGKLQPGDQLVKFAFWSAGADQEKLERALHGRNLGETTEIDDARVGWPSVIQLGTMARLPDSQLVATVKRGSEEITAEIASVPSQEVFIDDRNLPFRSLQEMHQAKSWGEAARLGGRELKERVTEVLAFIQRLATGRISFTQIGGPVSIVRVATSEADRGVTDLLLFFTFLSANLAVINFLPIPALDGGHMLFLTYEAIFRRPVNENLQMKLSLLGILALLSLMVFATVLDIGRLFG